MWFGCRNDTLGTLAIYVHRDPVDFRQSINSLSIRVNEVMELDAFSSSLFVCGNPSCVIPMKVCVSGDLVKY